MFTHQRSEDNLYSEDLHSGPRNDIGSNHYLGGPKYRDNFSDTSSLGGHIPFLYTFLHTFLFRRKFHTPQDLNCDKISPPGGGLY